MVSKNAARGNGATTETAEPTNEVVRRFTEEHFRSVETLEDAMAMYTSVMDEDIVDAADEIGDGFTPVDDGYKRKLVGAPMFLMQWAFVMSEKVMREGQPTEYVAIRLVAQVNGKNVKVLVSDGGTGIYRQLKNYSERTGRFSGMAVANGLRVSDYKYRDGQGNESDAATYYLDNAPGDKN